MAGATCISSHRRALRAASARSPCGEGASSPSAVSARGRPVRGDAGLGGHLRVQADDLSRRPRPFRWLLGLRHATPSQRGRKRWRRRRMAGRRACGPAGRFPACARPGVPGGAMALGPPRPGQASGHPAAAAGPGSWPADARDDARFARPGRSRTRWRPRFPWPPRRGGARGPATPGDFHSGHRRLAGTPGARLALRPRAFLIVLDLLLDPAPAASRTARPGVRSFRTT